MKKAILLFMTILMLCSIVYSITPGESFILTTMPNCNSVYVVEVQQEGNNTDDYTLKDCTKTDSNKWTCQCSNRNLTLQTMLETKNKYDFTIRYEVPIIKSDYSNISNNKTGPSQLQQAIDDSKRHFEINNIEVKEDKPEKEPFVFPELEGLKLILILIAGFILVIVFVIGLVLYWLLKSEEPLEESRNKQTLKQDAIAKYLNEKTK